VFISRSTRSAGNAAMTIIPVRPAADSTPVDGARADLLRRTLGRYLPSRRTLGVNHPSRRTFGVSHPSRRTFGISHP
jgi:hypothetical protein